MKGEDMYYIYNGNLLKNSDKFENSPFNEGLGYGYALFETVKVTNSKAEFLDAHLQRLHKSLVALNIDLIIHSTPHRSLLTKMLLMEL